MGTVLDPPGGKKEGLSVKNLSPLPKLRYFVVPGLLTGFNQLSDGVGNENSKNYFT